MAARHSSGSQNLRWLFEPAKFEVASIKPATPDNQMTGCVTRAGARCAPGALRNLISMSLQVSSNFEEDIVVGLSKFADKAHFHEKAGPCQAVFRSTYSYSRLPTNGRPNLASSLSFLERFFVRRQRYRRSPTSGRRTMLPSRILKSPTRPTSIRTLGGAVAPVPAGCSQLETGAAVSEPNWISLSPATSFLARAQSPELGDLLRILSSCFLPCCP
jgi:hypothetical protein